MAEIFYHGSPRLFTKFNLDYALEGQGKVKFGYGVYVTSSFASAANYSKSADWEAAEENHYVYTVEVVNKKAGNYISFVEQVSPLIISKAEDLLQDKIPEIYTLNGNLFRKYLGMKLSADKTVIEKLKAVSDPDKARLKVGIKEERAASDFLYKIGVRMIEWPFTWKDGETRTNRAILKADSVKIIRIEEVILDAKGKYVNGSSMLVKDLSGKPRSVAPFIREYYPEYWGMNEYPITECVAVHKTGEYWGIFCNFAHTPILVNGVEFKTSEQLFQVLKFSNAEYAREVYNAPQPKMTAKKLEILYRRTDWGKIFIDVMKFCLMMKYEQNKDFRDKLNESKGKYIIEDQSTFPKKSADAWGVKIDSSGEKYVGPNLLGKLLMELRDNGTLIYDLPDDIFDSIAFLK